MDLNMISVRKLRTQSCVKARFAEWPALLHQITRLWSAGSRLWIDKDAKHSYHSWICELIDLCPSVALAVSTKVKCPENAKRVKRTWTSSLSALTYEHWCVPRSKAERDGIQLLQLLKKGEKKHKRAPWPTCGLTNSYTNTPPVLSIRRHPEHDHSTARSVTAANYYSHLRYTGL